MRKDNKELYEFGPFRLDVLEHRLETTDGESARAIPDKAFQTLVYLVRNSGSLVTKQELLDTIWPDAIVEENNLDKAIHTIRHALGESEGQKYIETVRKHGYRFVAEVHTVGGFSVHARDLLPTAEGEKRDFAQDVLRGLAKPQVTMSGQHVLFDLVSSPSVAAGPSTEGIDEGKKAGANAPATDRVEPDAHDKTAGSYRWVLVVGTGVILLAGILAAAGLWRSEPQTDPPKLNARRITSAGGTARSVLSPNGRQAAVVINNGLVIMDLDNGNERLVVPAAPGLVIIKLAFTPDGSRIFYGTKPSDGSLITIYSIPVIGGEPTKILDDTYSSLSFSPDGKKFAFLRRYPELNEYAILTADASGSNVTNLASSRLPNRFEGNPEWSPDGKTIACSAISIDGGFHFTFALIDVASGRTEFVPDQRWVGLNSLAWLPDSKTVILAGQDEQSTTAQVWRVDTKTGARTRLVNDPYVYESISGSSDGSRFVAVRVRQSSQVWMLGERPVQLTAGFDNADGVGGLSWLRDGNVLYHSRVGGRNAIWRMRADGSNAAMITTDQTGGFAVSPDGRFLVFQGKQSADHLGLQIRDLNTGEERSLTKNITAMSPSFFPDGKRVAFSVYDKELALYEAEIDGGSPRLLNDEFRAAMVPSVSPSGKLIAFGINKVENGKLQTGIAVLDHATGRVISTYPVKTTSTVYEEPTIQWSADESAVYFILLENYRSNIMRINIANGEVSKVTSFTEGRIFNFAVEPGTDRILAARGHLEKEATLLQLDRPF